MKRAIFYVVDDFGYIWGEYQTHSEAKRNIYNPEHMIVIQVVEI